MLVHRHQNADWIDKPAGECVLRGLEDDMLHCSTKCAVNRRQLPDLRSWMARLSRRYDGHDYGGLAQRVPHQRQHIRWSGTSVLDCYENRRLRLTR